MQSRFVLPRFLTGFLPSNIALLKKDSASMLMMHQLLGSIITYTHTMEQEYALRLMDIQLRPILFSRLSWRHSKIPRSKDRSLRFLNQLYLDIVTTLPKTVLFARHLNLSQTLSCPIIQLLCRWRLRLTLLFWKIWFFFQVCSSVKGLSRVLLAETRLIKMRWTL